MTVLEILNRTTDLLNEKKIEDARLNAELILSEVMKCSRLNLYLNFDKPVDNEETELFRNYLNRRLKHEPLQYIFGKAQFYGMEFIVNESVLIPRPETELLVEKILTEIKGSNKNPVSIFEIGCGSGCIPLALAYILTKENINFEIFSIDNSTEAIKTANRNLSRLFPEIKTIRFYKKDVFEIQRLTKSYDYIVSNPPYISGYEYNLLDSCVKDYEPGEALTDFGTGLKYFEKIFSIAADKNFNGKVFCEIGFGQKENIEILLKEKNLIQYFFYKDYSNIDRVLEVIK